MNAPIYNKLRKLEQEQRIPFHMPGHKRVGNGDWTQIQKMDITEIVDYDNLHHPEEIIRESMDMLKEIYNTRESWYLINGSTVGILAAISACCNIGDKILISRNCHKSVYNAVYLLHLETFYFYPECSEKYTFIEKIGDEQIKRIQNILKENPDIKAVVLPSPTYEGVVMDIEKLKRVMEPYEAVLIVDEAHGAHFIFHNYFPKSAVECGADIVIQSTHKTLPSITQTALLHLCSDKIAPEKISNMLSVYESSSPSYILMSSAEYGVAYMNENVDEVQTYVDNLQNFREKCEQLHSIHLINKEDLSCRDYDEGKLVFSTRGTSWNGNQLFERLLHQYHIEFEMANRFHCIAMTSVCDREKMYYYLFQALKELDKEIQKRDRETLREEIDRQNMWRKPVYQEKAIESWQCTNFDKENVDLNQAEGRIAGNFVFLYPPGIPLLVPGEKILKETVENLRYYIYNRYNVLGVSGDNIIVLKKRK